MSVLLLPADGCPDCVTAVAEPSRVEPDRGSLRASYTCTSCGHTWVCWWNPTALEAA